MLIHLWNSTVPVNDPLSFNRILLHLPLRGLEE